MEITFKNYGTDFNMTFNELSLFNMPTGDMEKKKNLILAVGKAIIFDKYGATRFNPIDNLIIGQPEGDIMDDLFLINKITNFPALDANILFNVFARHLLSYQILFNETETGIEPIEVRVNSEVKGALYGKVMFDVENLNIKIKEWREYEFALYKEEEALGHITVFLKFFEQNKPLVFWDLIFKNRQNTNTNIEWLMQYSFLNEEEFLQHAKTQGIPVSSKTLRNYRSSKYQSIFPEPHKIRDKKTGLIKKYYDRTWIKYLNRIEDLKKIAREKKYKFNVNKIRDLDKEIGGNFFDSICIRKD